MENYNELYHYGIKGMKWGVRRDIRNLANHRRNVAVDRAKRQHALGKITSEQKKASIQKANIEKKAYIKKTETDYKNAKNQRERNSIERDITRQSINEIPNRSIKNGARTANGVLTGIDIGVQATSVALATAAAPPLGPLYITALAGYTAGAMGRKWLIDKGLDKLA